MVLAVAAPTDPSDIGFPPTLPYELMMRVLPAKEIIDAYGLTQQEWDQLRVHPQFIEACRAAHKELQEEGASFRIKAKLQSEDLLKTSWNLIHDQHEQLPERGHKCHSHKHTERRIGERQRHIASRCCR